LTKRKGENKSRVHEIFVHNVPRRASSNSKNCVWYGTPGSLSFINLI